MLECLVHDFHQPVHVNTYTLCTFKWMSMSAATTSYVPFADVFEYLFFVLPSVCLAVQCLCLLLGKCTNHRCITLVGLTLCLTCTTETCVTSSWLSLNFKYTLLIYTNFILLFYLFEFKITFLSDFAWLVLLKYLMLQ